MLAIELHNLFLADVSAAFCPADSAEEATTIVQTVRVAPVALKGRLLDGASRLAVAGHPLVLLDGQGKVLAELTSNEGGNYTLPVLDPGQYVLAVQDGLQLQLAVDANAKIEQLDIVVPQGQGPQRPRPRVQDPKKTPAAPGGAAPKRPKPAPKPLPVAGLSAGTWALIGGGTAVVAAPIVANAADGGGGGEAPVSESGLGVRR